VGVAEIQSEVATLIACADRVRNALAGIARVTSDCQSSVAIVTTGSGHRAAIGARDVRPLWRRRWRMAWPNWRPVRWP